MADFKEDSMPTATTGAPDAGGTGVCSSFAGPSAKHLVEVCSSTCCSGPLPGDRFFRQLCELAGVDPELGGVSADHAFRLQRAECLDVCDHGPILRIDGAAIFKQVSLERTGKLLDLLRSGQNVSDVGPDGP